MHNILLLFALLFFCGTATSKRENYDLRISFDLFEIIAGNFFFKEQISQFQKWRAELKKGLRSTLDASNVEYDTSLIVLYGTPYFHAEKDHVLWETCYAHQATYASRLAIVDFIEKHFLHELNTLTQEVEQTSGEEVLHAALARMQSLSKILSFYQGLLEQMERHEKTIGDQKVTYTWELLQKTLFEGSKEATRIAIQKIHVDKLFYPGHNWSNKYGFPYEESSIIASPLTYQNGVFQITLHQSTDDICLRKIPLRIELTVDYTYEIRTSPDKTHLTQASRQLALTGMNLFNMQFEWGLESMWVKRVTKILKDYQEKLNLKNCLALRYLSPSYELWTQFKAMELGLLCQSSEAAQRPVCKLISPFLKQNTLLWEDASLKDLMGNALMIIKTAHTTDEVNKLTNEVGDSLMREYPLVLTLSQYDSVLDEICSQKTP